LDDWRRSSHAERLDVVSRWHAARADLSKQKKQRRSYLLDSSRRSSQNRLSNINKQSFGSNQSAQSERQRTVERSLDDPGNCEGASIQAHHKDAEYEQAIRESVAATSTGNVEEDAMIERAIRASIAELKRASADDDDRDPIQRAIQASVVEAGRAQPRQSVDNANSPGTSSDHDRMLEQALRMSMNEHDRADELQGDHLDHDWDDSGVATDDDENIKRAIENSKADTRLLAHHTEVPENGSMESRKNRETLEKPDIAARSEEEIVLEYVKRQSLLEEQHKQSLAAGRKEKGDQP
jgi:hypothetical protein